MQSPSSDNALKEVGEGFKSILERIADFFDIFDLSFIVSGATTATALAFWVWRAEIVAPPIPTGWLAGVGLIIGCYVLGLVCFALGRWIRMGFTTRRSARKFDKKFREILAGHGLETESPFAAYLARENSRGIWRLYVRLWAELRMTADLVPSFSLLRRYWVMAATYDGGAIALIVWAGVIMACAFGLSDEHQISPTVALPTAGVLIVAAVACLREAGRYVKYQVEELVASIAAKRSRV